MTEYSQVMARHEAISIISSKHNCIVMNKQFFIYIMTNPHNRVLYAGVTNDLKRRVYEHKNKLVAGFTQKYNVVKLVYYEIFQSPNDAIAREKQIKGGSRQKKLNLVNSVNPEWRDLYDEICQ